MSKSIHYDGTRITTEGFGEFNDVVALLTVHQDSETSMCVVDEGSSKTKGDMLMYLLRAALMVAHDDLGMPYEALVPLIGFTRGMERVVDRIKTDDIAERNDL